jgi:hypothetical protein
MRYVHNRTGQVSDGTIIKETNTLKKLFDVAFDLDKIPTNPAQRARLPQAPEGRTRFLTLNNGSPSLSLAASSRLTKTRSPNSGYSGPPAWP